MYGNAIDIARYSPIARSKFPLSIPIANGWVGKRSARRSVSRSRRTSFSRANGAGTGGMRRPLYFSRPNGRREVVRADANKRCGAGRRGELARHERELARTETSGRSPTALPGPSALQLIASNRDGAAVGASGLRRGTGDDANPAAGRRGGGSRRGRLAVRGRA